MIYIPYNHNTTVVCSATATVMATLVLEVMIPRLASTSISPITAILSGRGVISGQLEVVS